MDHSGGFNGGTPRTRPRPRSTAVVAAGFCSWPDNRPVQAHRATARMDSQRFTVLPPPRATRHRHVSEPPATLPRSVYAQSGLTTSLGLQTRTVATGIFAQSHGGKGTNVRRRSPVEALRLADRPVTAARS